MESASQARPSRPRKTQRPRHPTTPFFEAKACIGAEMSAGSTTCAAATDRVIVEYASHACKNTVPLVRLLFLARSARERFGRRKGVYTSQHRRPTALTCTAIGRKFVEGKPVLTDARSGTYPSQ